AGGSLEDLGPLVSPSFDELCRAELRIDGPGGTWTVRLASPISDDPAALVWDDEALLVVKYGFMTYAFESRTGGLRWSHRSASARVPGVGRRRALAGPEPPPHPGAPLETAWARLWITGRGSRELVDNGD